MAEKPRVTCPHCGRDVAVRWQNADYIGTYDHRTKVGSWCPRTPFRRPEATGG